MNFAELLLPDFSLILCGWLVCRYTALGRSVWQQVDTLVYYFLFPVMLFHAIVRKPLDLQATSGLIVAGVGLGLAAIALAYLLPRLPWLGRHLDARDHAASAQVAFRFNSYITLAIIERVSGPSGLALVAVLIGLCVPLFNMAAVWPMARQSGAHFGRALARNPLILGTVAGLLANLAGLPVPAIAEPALTRIGQAAITLGLLAAGAGMGLSSLGSARVLAVSVLTIKHLLLPLGALGMAIAFRLDPLQATVLLAFAAMPTAPSTYVLATKMGYNGPLVGAMVTLSTVLGAASLAFALGVLAPLL